MKKPRVLKAIKNEMMKIKLKYYAKFSKHPLQAGTAAWALEVWDKIPD